MGNLIKVSVWPKPRLGLSESLEQYAWRHQSIPHVMRAAWRLEGLRLLNVVSWVRELATNALPMVTQGICAIAPGVSVPTKAVTEFDE